MAHYLPRKKYLSKLLGDSPEDKYAQTSNIDGTSCDKLAPNESTESLMTAIANSTRLGISSEFGSAVFTIDTNGNCSSTEVASSGESKDQTNYPEGPSNSSSSSSPQKDTQLQYGIDDDDKTCESEDSPVYFDDGSMDDDDENESGMKCGADLMGAEVTGSSAVGCRLQTSQMNSTDMVTQSSMPLTSSSDQLAISGSVSMSNLIDDDVLNTLLPSAESFANLLNSLESKDKQQMLDGSNHDQQQQQQQQHSQAELSVSCLATQTNEAVSSRHLYTTAKAMTAASFEQVCVKEEQIDSSYEHQKLPTESLMTTSGRNRGRGKASEPKYECQICGDVAAGYHCGAYVCEACKVSFPFSHFSLYLEVALLL